MAETYDRDVMRSRMKRRLVAQRARSGYRFRNPDQVSDMYAKKRRTTQPVDRPAPFMQKAAGPGPTPAPTPPAAPAQSASQPAPSLLR